MKNQILLLVSLLMLFNISFSQENRNNREWNNSNQTTYYMGDDMKVNSDFRGELYPESRTNNPDIDAWDDATRHRSKAIWSDNSTIVSDEKTGMHAHIPYPYVSEDDVLWAKRLQKLIDLRIPQNHPLFFPVEVTYDDYDGKGDIPINEVLNGFDARKNLFQVLKDAATAINPQTGQPLVSVYNNSLTRKYTLEEVIGNRQDSVLSVFQYKKPVPVYDPETFEEIGLEVEIIEFEASEIVGYYVVEEVFFDKRRARLDFRYVSVTPLVRDPDVGAFYSGANRTVKELGTFYFPEVRHLLANHKVFPLNGNLAQRMSFDEFFHRKLFASNLLKETNMYDRNIRDYLPGRTLDQLLEGERIKEQIRLYESDMWNY